MDPIRRELFRALSKSPEKRRSTTASRTTTEDATFVQIPTARTVIPFGSKKQPVQRKIEEEQDEGFIQIPKFASAPTKTSSSLPARQTLPTIVFGQGDSKKVFVHPNTSASMDSEPESLSEDSDVAVIAEIKLGRQSGSFSFIHHLIFFFTFLCMIVVPSASELLKSPSPKKASQQQTELPSAAKQSPHHSTSSPNKRPAPSSSPEKSPLAKKKQKMVSFKDIRPIQANGTFLLSLSLSCGISNSLI